MPTPEVTPALANNVTAVNAPYNRVQTADQLHTTNPSAFLLSNLNLGFANTTSLNAVATALNPGVSPPDYTTPNHYIFHHRLGENIRCAPELLGMEAPSANLMYPRRTMLEQIGQPELLLENRNPLGGNNNFPALQVPPAPPGNIWVPHV